MSNCPTCGQPVRVVSSDEGTSHYEASAGYGAQVAAAEERAAHWKGNHDYQVGLKQKQHAMIAALRDALEHYGSHDLNCTLSVAAGNECRCGLRQILDSTASAAAGYGPLERRDAEWKTALTLLRDLWRTGSPAQTATGESLLETLIDMGPPRSTEPDTAADKES